jgi:hypothetical protein
LTDISVRGTDFLSMGRVHGGFYRNLRAVWNGLERRSKRRSRSRARSADSRHSTSPGTAWAPRWPCSLRRRSSETKTFAIGDPSCAGSTRTVNRWQVITRLRRRVKVCLEATGSQTGCVRVTCSS